MISEKHKIYTSLSAFSDKGMDIFHNPEIPNMSQNDLLNIANYYSVILNYGESTGALYGPLPVAYHTGLLLYVYTFELENPNVKDQRFKEKEKVPAFLLIFFPTAAEEFTTKARDAITTEISTWLKQFTKTTQVTNGKIKNLTTQIEASIYKEQNKYEMSEIEEATVVLGKSFELLHNVLKYKKEPMKLLISGTDDLLISIIRIAVFEKNSSLITYYKADEEKIEYKLNNIEGTILLTSVDNPNLGKYLTHNLKGVIHFGNFSTPISTEAHTNELRKIIKQTNQNCIVSFVISQNDDPIKINDTKIPEILKEGIGRSISLIDLGQSNISLGSAIIEFLEKLIDNVGKSE